jgi:hypothetical protein
MAFRQYLDFSNSNAEGEFKNGVFNVNQAVGGSEYGTGLPANCVTDMQLVYYFLYMICRYGDRRMFPVSSPEVFNNVKLQPRYQNYHSNATKKDLATKILIFQENLQSNGRNVYRDGRCDKARSMVSSISKTNYTIHFANYHYAKIIESWQKRNDWQNYLLNDLMLPDEVRAELLISSSL